jgi:hypothetical protein
MTLVYFARLHFIVQKFLIWKQSHMNCAAGCKTMCGTTSYEAMGSIPKPFDSFQNINGESIIFITLQKERPPVETDGL